MSWCPWIIKTLMQWSTMFANCLKFLECFSPYFNFLIYWLNRSVHIRHLWRKTTVLSCHSCLRHTASPGRGPNKQGTLDIHLTIYCAWACTPSADCIDADHEVPLDKEVWMIARNAGEAPIHINLLPGDTHYYHYTNGRDIIEQFQY